MGAVFFELRKQYRYLTYERSLLRGVKINITKDLVIVPFTEKEEQKQSRNNFLKNR